MGTPVRPACFNSMAVESRKTSKTKKLSNKRKGMTISLVGYPVQAAQAFNISLQKQTEKLRGIKIVTHDIEDIQIHWNEDYKLGEIMTIIEKAEEESRKYED